MPASLFALGDDAVSADLFQLAQRARAARIWVARQDVNEFIAFVIRDDRDNKPVRQAAVHERIQALADRHKRFAILAMPECGKTIQLGIGRFLFELGHNPSLRHVVIAATHGKAVKTVKAIANYIETSEELHDVFPNLKPGNPWRPDAGEITIERSSFARDPSVKAFGFQGDILGARVDRMLIDDILTQKNTATRAQRNKVFDWVFGTLWSRLTPGARVTIMGNAWHPDDLLHRIDRMEGWHVERIPALVEGESSWPAQWPLKRIEEKRKELGPLEFARQMMCEARSDEDARFKRGYIERCVALGAGLTVVKSLREYRVPITAVTEEQYTTLQEQLESWRNGGGPFPLPIYTGVDLAVSKSAAADETAVVSLAILPNGRRHLLRVVAGKWSFTEILDKIKEAHAAFGSIVTVENVAAQDYLVQHLRETTSIPVIPYTTGKTKADPTFGVESISAQMAGSQWVIPSSPDGSLERLQDPGIIQLVTEALHYSPASHTGDRLMALWLATEGIRKTSPDTQNSVSVFTIGG